jgi:hypothetical protein
VYILTAGLNQMEMELPSLVTVVHRGIGFEWRKLRSKRPVSNRGDAVY